MEKFVIVVSIAISVLYSLLYSLRISAKPGSSFFTRKVADAHFFVPILMATLFAESLLWESLPQPWWGLPIFIGCMLAVVHISSKYHLKKGVYIYDPWK